MVIFVTTTNMKTMKETDPRLDRLVTIDNEPAASQEYEDTRFSVFADGTRESCYEIAMEIGAPNFEEAWQRAVQLLPAGASITKIEQI